MILKCINCTLRVITNKIELVVLCYIIKIIIFKECTSSSSQATAAKNVNLVHVYFFEYKMYQAT